MLVLERLRVLVGCRGGAVRLWQVGMGWNEEEDWFGSATCEQASDSEALTCLAALNGDPIQWRAPLAWAGLAACGLGAIAESRAEIRSFFSASRRFTFSPPSPDVVLSPLDDNAALAAASFSFSSRRVAYTCIIGISTVDL